MVGSVVGEWDRLDELHVVAVLASLLRICRDHAAALDARLARSPTVAIVLAGSRHLVDTASRRVNRARLLVRGLPPDVRLHHDKFAGFAFEGLVERIERPNRVTLVVGRRWSFTPLICRDFLQPDVRALLARVRVRAVLVAALSPKTELFCRDALALATDGQCLVFVSNTPLEPRGHTAIFARPLLGVRALAEHRVDEARDGLVVTVATTDPSFQLVTPT